MKPDPADAHAQAELRGDVAIVGMACMYPKALDLKTFWGNIVSGVDAITELPPGRFPETFYDLSTAANDHTYCGRGGFLGVSVPFDPLQFGIMPLVTEGGDPEQFLALHTAHEALKDAGYDPERMDGTRTEIIIGRGNYANRALSTAQHHVSVINEVLGALKAVHPGCTDTELSSVRQELLAGLPRFGPDNAASLVPNLTTGRIANRFDCMGTNFTVDAACASSLVALELGMRNLLSGKCDVALAGGAFIMSDLTHIAVLTQVQVLSRHSEIRPFDKDADGTIMGEGVGILVLKRLEDARQAGDRIYAVVKGVGSSSDGRGLGLLAPRVEGEELALRRAYDMAGIDPATVGLIEAHGTGTPTGDATEIQALSRVFGARSPDAPPHVAIGAVKSMIGHSLPASGAAGLIKTALALYHKILPPTLHCEEPNPHLGLEQTPFYINTTTRPWIHGSPAHPRRAGVSAFGFGGSNAHAILEELRDDPEESRPSLLTEWPAEVCVLSASERAGLIREATYIAEYLASGPEIRLADLAYTLNTKRERGPERIAIVAGSLEDLRKKIERACERLRDAGCEKIKDPSGIYYFSQPLSSIGKLAIVFPGEGAQYAGMLADLCQHFPVVRGIFDRADSIGSIAHVFPPAWPAERKRSEQRLWSSVSGAAQAVLTADRALYALFQRLGLRADAVVGHSSGDFTACLAAGIFAEDESMVDRLSHLWRAYDEPQTADADSGLLAAGAAADIVMSKLGDLAAQATVAMDNCPHQVVLAVSAGASQRAQERLLASNIFCERLAFSRAYHTEAFGPQLGPIRDSLNTAPVHRPSLPIYSCTTAALYPSGVEEIRDLMIDHWRRPVRFQETIRNMHADGVRVFLELGPRGNLTAFIDDILRGRPYLALSADNQRRHGVTQLNHVIGLLIAHGVPLQLKELYCRRSPQDVNPAERPADRRSRPKRTFALSTIQFQLKSRSGQEPAFAVTAQGVAATAVPHAAKPVETMPAEMTGAPTELVAMAASAVENGAMAAVAVADGDGLDPMAAYLCTMDQFLTVQQSVMQSFLSPAATIKAGEFEEIIPLAAAVADHTSNGHNGQARIDVDRYPLLGTFTSYVPGHELETERSLSLGADLFLRDHMLGRKISRDPELGPLATVPATVSIEIMAEAATALAPDLKVVGVRDFRSSRWINVADQRPTKLRITAKRARDGVAGAEVEVNIWSREAGAEPNGENAEAAAQGVVQLAPDYAAAPLPAPSPVKNGRPCRAGVAQLYDWLFHGPQFHALSALHEAGADGLSAELRTVPLENFLGPQSSESLIIDPVVLDGVGQLSAAWVYERIPDPGIMFPIQIEEITFFGPRYRHPAVLPCRLRLHHCDYRNVRADMEVIGPNGRVHIRVAGWRHYRIHTPANRITMSRDARSGLSGERWDVPVAPLPAEGKYVASLVDGLSEKGSFSMADACAHIVLSRQEREQWRAMAGPPNRKAQWLLGRAAAKDAARVYLWENFGLELYPAEVEVFADANGRPRVTGAWALNVPVTPALSLAHAGSIGVAVAGGSGPDDYLGIDIERIRPRDSGFLDMAFSAYERALIEALDEGARPEWVSRFWCAKEAAAKALGRGFIDGPRGLAVELVDWTTGRLELTLNGTFAASLRSFSGVRIVAYSARAGDLAVASTVCEKGASS